MTDAEPRSFQIRKGMDVLDEQGERLGELESILTETATGASRFITVQQHILPVETIRDVDGESIKVALKKEKLESFPTREGAQIPSQADLQRAYEAFGLDGPLVDKS